MRRSLGLLLALSSFAAPAGAREWYEAYQEGVRTLARGQYREAVSLLEEAIRQRPQPGVNLRTYGTNVERSYFPYLRLAEAHLGLNSPEGARAALQRSESLGAEPAGERARLRERLDQLVERLRPAAPPPPATTLSATSAASPPAPSAAPTVAATGPLTSATPSATPAPSEPPAPMGPATALPRAPAPQPRPPTAAATPAIAATPEASATATLEVFSEPAGAHVYVDDEPLGRTSPDTGRLVKRDLVPGRHRVRITLEGYEDLMHAVELSPGATATLHGPLARAAAAPARPSPMAILFAATALGALALWLHARRRRSASLFESTTERRRAARSPVVTPGPARTPPAEAATPTPEGALPARFGDYMLLERIGRGGMATVFKAERGGELRALKRPRGNVSDDPQFLERFLREAEIGLALHHPNIVRIFERGEAGDVPYFTMELIEGETLAARLKRQGALSAHEAARAVQQIAEALDYAHHKGVIHRDLKPSNTMLGRDGTLKVMDFGIARAQRFDGMTITGSFLGSPDYAAPETIEGRSVDARSDLYSLGVVLFELLTGRRPFEGDTPFSVLKKHCTEPPLAPSRLAPDVPPELEAITLRLLSKAPEGRFASAEELLQALRAWLDRQA